ncbi:MAG: hypothetical protein INH41_05280 [Myxococcaceae bacterium]|nr:hypothetical protein [Myxococcaceae bacterium]MCA3011797.1 hypothetical protein [Myxococcaceae bacterium]
MRTLFGLALLVMLGCGPSTLGGTCTATCDCPALAAPVRCPGEWTCNTARRCEYVCQDVCGSGVDAGCASPRVCRGSICSERATCP